MKIKDSNIDRFILKPDGSFNLFLFTGTDYGLSCTRFNNIISSFKIDLDDPFNCSKLEQKDLEKNSTVLLDDALTVSFNQKDRVIILKLYGDKLSTNIMNTIKVLLKNFPIENTKIFILAQNLSSSSALIKLISENKYSVVISSYQKSGGAIRNAITSILSIENVTITDDALNSLSVSLGDDHLNSIRKIESILSFIYPKKIISYDDVEKYSNDSSLIEIDNLVFSVFSGNKIGTIKNIDALYLSGLNSIEILKAVIRWSLNIKIACDIYKSGKNIEQAIQVSTPYIFWKIKPKFEKSIKLCKNLNLAKIIDRLLTLENKMKLFHNVDNALLSYSLLGITNLINRND
ncbi:MAG: hypothetical protein CMN37_04925 [SAR116 cluster bacterium]|nr:hypothetical protein [SAR116 cluster bacterium]